MKTAYTIARILLGLIFGALGMNGFVPFIPNPPTIPAPALAFFSAMASTHFSYFVFGAQVLAGLLLLANRYVPLALVVLGAVLANILAFHITMWPAALVPMPALATILWFVTAWPIRTHFAPIFTQKVEVA